MEKLKKKGNEGAVVRQVQRKRDQAGRQEKGNLLERKEKVTGP